MWLKPISNKCKHKLPYRTGKSQGAAGVGGPDHAVRSLFLIDHPWFSLQVSLIIFLLAPGSFTLMSLQFMGRPFLSQHPYIKSQGSLLGPVWLHAFTDHRGQAEGVAWLARLGSWVHPMDKWLSEWLAPWELHGTDQFSNKKNSAGQTKASDVYWSCMFL